ncbi:non-homologous end-joining DNA ligase [Cellulomonas carbonis]|uniref:ATP-dependent DNA ligase n=1 Tax=Cellulomonas carbonis T26 TaxID=947969 RepID=A0A0A0BSH0_9CELL|nr:non-homologous end-joining DNA ligase [Cellulomonas carbonis]KGM10860.1 ATP-dependent DNA ligase [Cellulomonas carbonis T26]GGB92487.1 ATP-dependent DNA ligase [Cellulomonas carbonis]
MTPADDAQWVAIGDRRVRLTHLDRVLYPSTGFTKAEMVQYYTQVAEAILPQLRDRPVTRIRFTESVAGERFFEKNVPRGAPDWLRRRVLRASPGGEDEGTEVEFPFVDDLAGLVWAANQGAVELHTPQWRVGPRGKVHHPDRLVVDLDPGPPAGLDACVRVARLVADRLTEDGLDRTYPVTSGSKGMQLYAPLDGRRTAVEVREYARTVAHELAAASPRTVVANMKKELRPGKVLVDWSQNHPAKTTVTPYSLRGRERPAVAAPRHWDEVTEGMQQLGPDEVLRRLDEDGDLIADLR